MTGDREHSPPVRLTASLLAAAFRGIAVVRRGKPIHPHGVVLPARLRRTGLPGGTGTGAVRAASWLEQPGDDPALVRLSRSAGFPEGLPDVWGLALRVPLEGARVGDLLLATSHAAPVARSLLAVRRAPRGAFTSVLPYRTDDGRSVLLAALPTGERALPPGRVELARELARRPLVLTLAVATPSGPWQPFGTLTVGTGPARGTGDGGPASSVEPADADLSFDPVLHPLPGLAIPRAVGELRRRAYVGARRGRRATRESLDAPAHLDLRSPGDRRTMPGTVPAGGPPATHSPAFPKVLP